MRKLAQRIKGHVQVCRSGTRAHTSWPSPVFFPLHHEAACLVLEADLGLELKTDLSLSFYAGQERVGARHSPWSLLSHAERASWDGFSCVGNCPSLAHFIFALWFWKRMFLGNYWLLFVHLVCCCCCTITGMEATKESGSLLFPEYFGHEFACLFSDF